MTNNGTGFVISYLSLVICQGLEATIGQVSNADEIEDRPIDFAVLIIKLADAFPKTLSGKHIGSQLLRSGTSPGPNMPKQK